MSTSTGVSLISGWRFARPFPQGELSVQLDRLQWLPVSPQIPTQTRVLPGWRREESVSVVVRESPGPPLPSGAFARACAVLACYAFSDPRIIAGHFAPPGELLGRQMLLELKALGLRYLCGVRIGAVRDEQRADRTVFGFRSDTLAGHVERGSEWFTVSKDHKSGEVSFRIEMLWQEGDFPNWWSRAGFAVLSRYYRHLWQSRAHNRLRALIDEQSRAEKTDGKPRLWTLGIAAGLGAITGLRGLVGPALVARQIALEGPDPAAGKLAKLAAAPELPLILGSLAAMELVVDKLPGIPDRTVTPSLVGRLAIAGAIGIATTRRDRQVAVPAIMLAISAAAGTAFAAVRVRKKIARRWHVPDVILGLLEDVLAIAMGRWLARKGARHQITVAQGKRCADDRPGHYDGP